MATDIYERLAEHLDNLPGGYPGTESGVELRLLRRLFTPEQAELATHLTLIAEEPRVVARRAGISKEEAEVRLSEMAQKGLIVSLHPKGRPIKYMAAMFIVGIYEFQVDDLEPELIHDFEEYLPALFDAEAWKKVPQLRTIPVGESVESRLEMMPYEQAEDIVRGQDKIVVAPCICRREQKIVAEGCDKPEEVCMSFGTSADYYQHRGTGRVISQSEALEVLGKANEAGLVLQPSNAKQPEFICCCCGCCCGVLRSMKRHPKPASLVSSPFYATLKAERCEGCGLCEGRCQMEALKMGDDRPVLDLDRCIGCGLCVSECPTGALKLVRKPDSELTTVPKNVEEQYISLSRARGKVNTAGLVKMMVKSKVDRLLATGRESA